MVYRVSLDRWFTRCLWIDDLQGVSGKMVYRVSLDRWFIGCLWIDGLQGASG